MIILTTIIGNVERQVGINKKKNGFLFLDSQELVLFKGNALDTFLVRAGYGMVACVFGTELVLYHGRRNTSCCPFGLNSEFETGNTNNCRQTQNNSTVIGPFPSVQSLTAIGFNIDQG